jgi:hypothetical protein
MSIKLTKTIDGKKVELDVIFLNGKAVVKNDNFDELKKNGLTKAALKGAGYGVESDELDKIEAKKAK